MHIDARFGIVDRLSLDVLVHIVGPRCKDFLWTVRLGIWLSVCRLLLIPGHISLVFSPTGEICGGS